MSHQDRTREIIKSLRWIAETKAEDCAAILLVTLLNYEPTWLDEAKEMDKIVAENERLKAIVDLIYVKQARLKAFKNERDALAARVAELEKAE